MIEADTLPFLSEEQNPNPEALSVLEIEARFAHLTTRARPYAEAIVALFFRKGTDSTNDTELGDDTDSKKNTEIAIPPELALNNPKETDNCQENVGTIKITAYTSHSTGDPDLVGSSILRDDSGLELADTTFDEYYETRPGSTIDDGIVFAILTNGSPSKTHRVLSYGVFAEKSSGDDNTDLGFKAVPIGIPTNQEPSRRDIERYQRALATLEEEQTKVDEIFALLIKLSQSGEWDGLTEEQKDIFSQLEAAIKPAEETE